jgi:hypothetical protein
LEANGQHGFNSRFCYIGFELVCTTTYIRLQPLMFGVLGLGWCSIAATVIGEHLRVFGQAQGGTQAAVSNHAKTPARIYSLRIQGSSEGERRRHAKFDIDACESLYKRHTSLFFFSIQTQSTR